MNCGRCKIMWEERFWIMFCPLHAATDDLLTTSKAVYAMIGRDQLASAQDALLSVIAKAEGRDGG